MFICAAMVCSAGDAVMACHASGGGACTYPALESHRACGYGALVVTYGHALVLHAAGRAWTHGAPPGPRRLTQTVLTTHTTAATIVRSSNCANN